MCSDSGDGLLPTLSVDELLGWVEESGLRVVLSVSGEPRLFGTKRPSDELVRQLKLNRDAIVSRLSDEWWRGKIERDGPRLFRFTDGGAWYSIANMGPCECGGTRFFRTEQRMACIKCLTPRENESVLGEVDVLVIRKMLK